MFQSQAPLGGRVRDQLGQLDDRIIDALFEVVLLVLSDDLEDALDLLSSSISTEMEDMSKLIGI